jgi:hypothetical protein
MHDMVNTMHKLHEIAAPGEGLPSELRSLHEWLAKDRDFEQFIRKAKKLRNRKHRHSYVVDYTRRFLARQMRAFRGERSQSEFGDLIGKRRTQVSRLEDPAYGKWTLQTLFDVAEKLEVEVFVRFVDHSTFLRLSEAMDQETQVGHLAASSDHRK